MEEEGEMENPSIISSKKEERDLDAEILEKVGEVISAIDAANHVDQVICALHSLSLLIFPIDSSLFSGSIGDRYRDRVLNAKVPSQAERNDWKHAFYRGSAFPALARALLYNVASNWLACFPFSARTHVYDSFFVNGPSSETVQALVPVLQHSGTMEDVDFNSVCSNAERLLVLCLLEYEGIRYMVRDFSESLEARDYDSDTLKQRHLPFFSRVAQLVASVPDKMRPKAPIVLSSQYP